MAGAFNQIRAALETAFSSYSTSFTKFYDNQEVIPVEGSSFLVGSVIMGPSTNATIGQDHLLEHRGIYQVLIVVPATRGSGMAYSEADSLHQTFTEGALVTSGTVSVRVTGFSVGPSSTRDNWFSLPVSITYHAFTTLP